MLRTNIEEDGSGTMAILDKKEILNDYRQESNVKLIIFFSIVNALLLAGIVGLVIDCISHRDASMLIIAFFLLCFFVGNTVAMVYETNHKKTVANSVRNNKFAIMKCRYLKDIHYTDTSSDILSITTYMEFGYFNGKRKFTWLSSAGFGHLEIGHEYWVLMSIKKGNKYHPLRFYSADTQDGYVTLADELTDCYIDEPINIDKKYAYPHYNNNGLQQ